MAKIIEEMANKKYNYPVEPYCFERGNEEQWYSCGLRDGYIEGATEQRKRDIELFGEWLEEHVMDYVSYDHLNGIDIDYSNITKGLRKAMEEE